MARNLVFAGVGGQGVLLAANVVGEAATAAGYETRVGEIHGMSQRGGSVLAHVRYGDGVYGPTVPEGTADALVGLEPMEALRYSNYLEPDAPIVLNFEPEMPFPVEEGDAEYPDHERLREQLGDRGTVHEIEATEIARNAGNPKAANAALLGALSAVVDLGLDRSRLVDAIGYLVPDDTVEANVDAFDRGREAAGTAPDAVSS